MKSDLAFKFGLLILFSNERVQVSLDKLLILRLKQEICKLMCSLKVPESQKHSGCFPREGYSKGTRKPTERTSSAQNWDKLSNEINKMALDYNAEDKINIHESILI